MERRLARLQTLLDEFELNGILVTAPSNRFYLSGFLSDDDGGRPTAALLVDRLSATLYTGSTNVEWARGSATGVRVEQWSRPWPAFIAGAIRDAGWQRVGFEDRSLSVSDFRELSQALGDDAQLVMLGATVDRLRRIKDDVEQARMARVIELTDAAFAEVVPDLRTGMTERDFAWRIDRAIRDLGGEGSAFPTIVASGPNAARPHHSPTTRRIEPGEPVIVDMGARLDGYNGDLTRTIWLGQPSAKLEEIYEIVMSANRAAWDEVRAGVAGKMVHEAAASVISNAGYRENYLHGTGHGLGILVHEAPSSSATSDDVLEPGDVMTIEPGIYLPGWGGVRIEDVGVVEETGFRRLTGAAK
ncbi:MAG TPA: aminopeptidase P family protein [Thermomicrobiales bacterium]|nr:aminopeptidase P family protein [Thermomicrobiales bacterium]